MFFYEEICVTTCFGVTDKKLALQGGRVQQPTAAAKLVCAITLLFLEGIQKFHLEVGGVLLVYLTNKFGQNRMGELGLAGRSTHCKKFSGPRLSLLHSSAVS